MGKRLAIVSIVVFVAMTAFGKWLLYLGASNRWAEAQQVMMAFVVVLYGAMFLPVLLLFRRKRTDRDYPLPATPPNVPAYAVPGEVYVQGSSAGWLWIERDFLVFHGEGFDFRLKATDFRHPSRLRKLLRSYDSFLLALPKGLSPFRLSFTPKFVVDGKAYRPTEAIAHFEPTLEAWCQSPSSDLPSLFPPLRPKPRPDVPTFPPKRWIVVATCVGGCLALFSYLFAVRPDTNPLTPFLAGFLLVASFVWPVQWLDRIASGATDRQIEKFKRENPAQ